MNEEKGKNTERYSVSYYENSTMPRQDNMVLRSLFFDDIEKAGAFALRLRRANRKLIYTGKPAQEFFYHGRECLADHLEAVLQKNSVEVKSNENESFYTSSLPAEKLKRLLTALTKAKILREEVRKFRREKVKEKKSD